MWMRKEKPGRSVTLTFFTIAFVFAMGKLLVSGLQIGSFTMGVFTGSDFAAVVGSLGGVYALRKMGPKEKEDDDLTGT